MDIVFAQGSDQVQLKSGAVAQVRKGQHWPSTDQVVRARPDLFTSDPRYGLLYTEAPPGYDAELNEVEEATAVPGEKRSARRS
jgi:hypothetical protein